MSKRWIAPGLLFIVLSLWLWKSEDVGQYVTAVKNQQMVSYEAGDTAFLRLDKEDQLLKRIQQESKQHEVAPVDARVDRVWKAIPGYNGLSVDIEQTYLLNKKQTKDQPLLWAFKEVPPKIQLEDLGAHPIYKGNPNKPMAALMINVAWGNEYLPSMLQTLADEKVKATFFLDGSWLRKNEAMAKEIQEGGHEISNHAYTHPNMSRLSDAAAKEEILKTEQLLIKNLQVKNKLFAPPSGDYNQRTVRIAHEIGLKTVLWTLDTVDWMKPKPEAIVRKIEQRVEPGSLILMHPTDSSSTALKDMIHTIRSKNLTLGTVSELLSSDRVTAVEPHTNF